MPELSQSAFDHLPLAAKQRIEAVCTRFEEAWKVGRPVLETFCTGVPADELPALLAELLHIDVEWRRRRGDAPAADDYLTLFPANETVIREVLPGQASSPAKPAALVSGGPQGVQVPGYEVLEELGRGGMGVVYRARHLALNRVVALKFILAGGKAPPRHQERFRTEAELVARLRHPNIVQIYDIGEVNGQIFLALEYADGGSLRERLAGPPMEPRAAVQLLEPLARAVQHAHRQGVVHRDIKPANILLAASGDSVSYCIGPLTGWQPSPVTKPLSPELLPPLTTCTPKLTDFGLAQLLDTEPSAREPGIAAGTPFYMSPEQASGGPIGPAADIWALGVNLYELLTGRPPFKAAGTLETLRLVLHAEPVPPSQMQPSVPRDLDTICLKCLQKDPARRYPGARELAQDLRCFLSGEAIHARPAGWLEHGVKWIRRHPLAAALAAFVLLMALVGIVVTVMGLAHAVTRRFGNPARSTVGKWRAGDDSPRKWTLRRGLSSPARQRVLPFS